MDSKMYADDVKMHMNTETVAGSFNFQSNLYKLVEKVENVATPHLNPQVCCFCAAAGDGPA
jgi:hypothetical protein